MKRAIITVIGKDMVGILSKVSGICAESNANVIEVTQSVLQELFAMIMLVEIDSINCEFTDFSQRFSDEGKKMGLEIHVMHEDIFNSMHRI